MQEAEKLRELAVWYREFAERADNPAIWAARVRMAEDLEEEADRLAPECEPRTTPQREARAGNAGRHPAAA